HPRQLPSSPHSPYTTLFRSEAEALLDAKGLPGFERRLQQRADRGERGQQRELIGEVAPARLHGVAQRGVERIQAAEQRPAQQHRDRKSTRLNSSHVKISYAV